MVVVEDEECLIKLFFLKLNDKMVDSKMEVRKKVDLHYGRTDFSQNRNYVEFSFHACFSELFNLDTYPWDYATNRFEIKLQIGETKLKGTELFDVLDKLKIVYNKELIFKKYLDEQNHSVEVFHNNQDEQVFAFFDLYKAPEDQIDMFFLGISCRSEDEKTIHEMLLNIYRKLGTASSFKFNILNHELYNKTFRSFFYFYKDDYNQYKRQMYHHGLSI